MTKTILLNCPPNGRYHFGIVAPDNDTALSQTSACFHSDTLFSVIINLSAKVFSEEETDELVSAFRAQQISVSSGNFCLKIFENSSKTPKKTVFFLPKPCQLDLQKIKIKDRKKYKRVAYISKTIWEKGLTPADWEKEGCYQVGQKFLLHRTDLSPNLGKVMNTPFKLITEPKIADHARKRKNNIFAQSDVHLQATHFSGEDLQAMDIHGLEDCVIQPHFYFLAKSSKAEAVIQKRFQLLLSLLPDEGIGGAISTGCGQIKSIEESPWEMNFSTTEISDNQEVSLSLVAAKSANADNIIYGESIMRGGRRTADYGTLDRVKMVKAGALIQPDFDGEIVAIHEKEKFLRYGKTFPISISKKYEL
jgi:CRISPR type III-A-associated RAMP protein Csm4